MHIKGAGVAKGMFYCLFSYLMKDDSFISSMVRFRYFSKMPCNCFTLTVGVCSQVHYRSCFGGFFKFIGNLGLLFGHYIFGDKTVFYVYSEPASGQVSNMTQRSHQDKLAAKNPGQCFGLCG